MLNPHHLELFYYVARHRGISRAVRHIPYGIQQPAVSGQMLQLEQHLGVKLFERSPFHLTPAGDELYAGVQPFFENLEALETRLRTGAAPQLRIGAAEPVLREHLPRVLRPLRVAQPGLRLSLRSAYQAQLEAWLLDRQIDLAITALEARPPAALRRLPLLRLPLVLLVPRRSRLRSAEELWRRPRLDEPLISPPPTETIARNFQRGLERRGKTWTPSIAASSLETVARYVADGYGIGISVADTVIPARVRALPLDSFAPVEIVALWTGAPSPIVTAALAAIRAYARARWPGQAPAPPVITATTSAPGA